MLSYYLLLKLCKLQCRTNTINSASQQDIQSTAARRQHSTCWHRFCSHSSHSESMMGEWWAFITKCSQKETVRVAGLIGLYEPTRTLKISLKLSCPSWWGYAKLSPHLNCTNTQKYTHGSAYAPHRSDYKSGYANFGLGEKLQPSSQCGNSVNKWSTKHKVLKERITKSLSFSRFPLFILFSHWLPNTHTHTHTHTHTDRHTLLLAPILLSRFNIHTMSSPVGFQEDRHSRGPLAWGVTTKPRSIICHRDGSARLSFIGSSCLSVWKETFPLVSPEPHALTPKSTQCVYCQQKHTIKQAQWLSAMWIMGMV